MKNNKSVFTGVGTALVTPFNKGEVDFRAYNNLLERQKDAKINFVVALGTTAETPCLLDDEKKRLLECACAIFPGKVMAGVGTNSLSGTLHNIRLLDSFNPGAWLIVVPYYNKPMQNGLLQYFKAIAENTDKDIFLYNIPGRTGVNIEPETIARLAEQPNIIGIKDANPDKVHLLKVRELTNDDFIVLSGNDDQWVELYEEGFDGVISVASNIIPHKMRELLVELQSGASGRAAAMDKELQPLYKACFVESNPIPVKGALSVLGLCSAEMRLPLTEAADTTVSRLKDALSGLGLL